MVVVALDNIWMQVSGNPELNEDARELYVWIYFAISIRVCLIEGMDKVRKVIEDNRKCKLTKHKKISNNTIIEIDNCSPLELLKLQTHETMKTRAYKDAIGKHYNMSYRIDDDTDTHYYECHDGRKLEHIRTESHQQDGYVQTLEVYACEDCSECIHKAKCLYKYNEERDKNKLMKINEQWGDLKAQSHENIESELGIINRQIRSIQTEGHFGDIKENENFRRFNFRSSEKVYKEFLLNAVG